MFFKKRTGKITQAMGFRKKIGERTCHICGVPEENNFDPKTGLLHQLRIIAINPNYNITHPSNYYYKCRVCRPK